MSFTYGFYNSVNGDRKYNAEQISAIFDGLISDGVYATVGNLFAVDVNPSVASGTLGITVDSGRAWFNHTWNNNDAKVPFVLDPADISLSRYDAVVIEVNNNPTVRTNRLMIVKGSLASNPPKPILTDTAYLHYHPLAYVKVRANASSIQKSDIENVVGRSECPFVTGIIDTASIDSLFTKWEGEFEEWFEDVKSQLEGDVVTNLLYKIDQKVSLSDKATSADITTGSPDKWVPASEIKNAVQNDGYEIGDIRTSINDLETETNGKWLRCDGRMITSSSFPKLSSNIGFEFGGVYNQELNFGNVTSFPAGTPTGTGNMRLCLSYGVDSVGNIACLFSLGEQERTSTVYLALVRFNSTGSFQTAKSFIITGAKQNQIHSSCVKFLDDGRVYCFIAVSNYGGGSMIPARVLGFLHQAETSTTVANIFDSTFNGIATGDISNQLLYFADIFVDNGYLYVLMPRIHTHGNSGSTTGVAQWYFYVIVVELLTNSVTSYTLLNPLVEQVTTSSGNSPNPTFFGISLLRGGTTLCIKIFTDRTMYVKLNPNRYTTFSPSSNLISCLSSLALFHLNTFFYSGSTDTVYNVLNVNELNNKKISGNFSTSLDKFVCYDFETDEIITFNTVPFFYEQKNQHSLVYLNPVHYYVRAYIYDKSNLIIYGSSKYIHGRNLYSNMSYYISGILFQFYKNKHYCITKFIENSVYDPSNPNYRPHYLGRQDYIELSLYTYVQDSSSDIGKKSYRFYKLDPSKVFLPNHDLYFIKAN